MMRGCLRLITPIIVMMIGVFVCGDLPHAAAQAAPDLTILTFNIRGGNRDYAAVAATILAQNADVVLLQEIWATPDRRLNPLLTAAYPYQARYPVNPKRQSLAIYSRYPLLNDAFNFYAPESSYARLQIALSNQIVTLYNVHLVNPIFGMNGFDPATSTEDVRQLLDFLASEPTPLIVAGDFNMLDTSESYALLSARYVNSFR